MSTAELDSAAEFERRAELLGVPQLYRDALRIQGLNTFGRFAFSVAYTPGQRDETPLADLAAGMNGGIAPTPAAMASLRRLFWESHTLALADLKQKSEHGSDGVTKKLPTAERKARADNQSARLTGVVWGPESQPSHQLVDRFVAMVEENVVSYVKPELCTSRSMEVLSSKTHQTFTLSSDGNLKVKHADQDSECPVSGEMRLREAYRRKALAMDIANLVSYTQAEEWHSYLFMAIQRETPKGFKGVSLSQIIAADKRLWILMSEATRGAVAALPGTPKPCDLQLDRLSSSPDVLSFLMPLPEIPEKKHIEKVRETPYDRPPKGKGKGKQQQPSNVPQVPADCSLTFGDNKPICGLYNRGKCWNKVKAGKRCQKGFHVCWKIGCNRHRPAHECTHTD